MTCTDVVCVGFFYNLLHMFKQYITLPLIVYLSNDVYYI